MIQTYHLNVTVNYTDGAEEDEEYRGLTIVQVHDKVQEILAVPTVSSIVTTIVRL